MTSPDFPPIMPYGMVIGQDEIKLALELSFIAPLIGGVLISGQRGTGKSTAVRAFARMMYGRNPVTLPINATEDRVVGGWEIDALMRQGEAKRQDGLLKEADGTVLYVDEVNLLDDHIVNIILDVTSTGMLPIQRDGIRDEQQTRFVLVGTMNPEEGLLRPQLLDRFGLMVRVFADADSTRRSAIIQSVLEFDAARAGDATAVSNVLESIAKDTSHAVHLNDAKEALYSVTISQEIIDACVRVTKMFDIQSHRGDLVLLTAARAHAALTGVSTVRPEDVQAVARLALQHRRPGANQGSQSVWSPPDPIRPPATIDDDRRVVDALGLAESAATHA